MSATPMTGKIHISKNSNLAFSRVALPASKSESNRLLIIDALSGQNSTIENLSEARDTQTMIRLLKSRDKTLDVLDAGTTMRFLTSYLAITNQNRILTGTQRMQERPIHILVDALREIGADVRYVGKEGFPPIETRGFKKQMKNHIRIRGDVSSQFISAILLVAPVLPQGLTLELTGKIGSRPYIDLTIALMREFGAKIEQTSPDQIRIYPKKYMPGRYIVESDWSGASYWYAMVALSKQGRLQLNGLRKNSFQGDQKISQIMRNLGVETSYNAKGILIARTNELELEELDFSDTPDLAQTLAAVSAGLGRQLIMTGIESLRIKETDRISALQNELRKIGADLKEIAGGHWAVSRANKDLQLPETPEIETYEDHRMAMAFAPLAVKTSLRISNPGVVSKSYPNFWEEMEKTGFRIQWIES